MSPEKPFDFGLWNRVSSVWQFNRDQMTALAPAVDGRQSEVQPLSGIARSEESFLMVVRDSVIHKLLDEKPPAFRAERTYAKYRQPQRIVVTRGLLKSTKCRVS